MSGWDEIKRQITESQVWQSIFRHGYDDTPRNRILMVSGNVWLHLHPSKVRRHATRLRFTWCMGGITFLLYLVTVVTGIYLMFYYRPTAEYAYADMKYLEYDMPFGMLMRNMHRWAAHGMVIAVWLHMCRVFLTGSYKPPREFNWVIGVLLLLVTLFMSFTGYLLPWDQLAFWAITVGTSIASYAPVFGKQIKFILLGDSTVGQEALLRFYVLHVAVLPAVLSLLAAIHFWRIRKDGGLSRPAEEDGLPVASSEVQIVQAPAVVRSALPSLRRVIHPLRQDAKARRPCGFSRSESPLTVTTRLAARPHAAHKTAATLPALRSNRPAE